MRGLAAEGVSHELRTGLIDAGQPSDTYFHRFESLVNGAGVMSVCEQVARSLDHFGVEAFEREPPYGRRLPWTIVRASMV